MNKLHSLCISSVLFAAPASVWAQAQTAGRPAAPSFVQQLMNMMPMLAIVFLIFYFMVLRPQERKIRDKQALLSSLSKGEQVITSGGIIGRVAGQEKDYILLEVSNNVKLKVETSNIEKRVEKEKPAK